NRVRSNGAGGRSNGSEAGRDVVTIENAGQDAIKRRIGLSILPGLVVSGGAQRSRSNGQDAIGGGDSVVAQLMVRIIEHWRDCIRTHRAGGRGGGGESSGNVVRVPDAHKAAVKCRIGIAILTGLVISSSSQRGGVDDNTGRIGRAVIEEGVTVKYGHQGVSTRGQKRCAEGGGEWSGAGE